MSDLLDHNTSETLDELAEIVAETLDGLAEAGAVTTPLPLVADDSSTVIEATLPIVGPDMRARLTVRTSLANAIALTVGFTDEPVDDVTVDDACGTLAEMCNVFGGSAKTMFSEETALEVPTCRAVELDTLTPLATAHVTHELGTFDVHVGED